MNKQCGFLLLLGLVGCATPAPEQVSEPAMKTNPVIIPIYNQRLVFQLPTHWKPAYQTENDNSYLIEFIPKNEDLANIGNILSVQGFKGLASRGSPEEFLNYMATSFQTTCGNQHVYQKLGKRELDGNSAYEAILGCAQLPKEQSSDTGARRSEIGYYLAIKGTDDMYLVHRSIRGGPFDVRQPPINPSNVRAFIAPMSPLKLCKNKGKPTDCLH